MIWLVAIVVVVVGILILARKARRSPPLRGEPDSSDAWLPGTSGYAAGSMEDGSDKDGSAPTSTGFAGHGGSSGGGGGSGSWSEASDAADTSAHDASDSGSDSGSGSSDGGSD